MNSSASKLLSHNQNNSSSDEILKRKEYLDQILKQQQLENELLNVVKACSSQGNFPKLAAFSIGRVEDNISRVAEEKGEKIQERNYSEEIKNTFQTPVLKNSDKYDEEISKLLSTKSFPEKAETSFNIYLKEIVQLPKETIENICKYHSTKARKQKLKHRTEKEQVLREKNNQASRISRRAKKLQKIIIEKQYSEGIEKYNHIIRETLLHMNYIRQLLVLINKHNDLQNKCLQIE